MREAEWRVIVRDPINQSTRYPTKQMGSHMSVSSDQNSNSNMPTPSSPAKSTNTNDQVLSQDNHHQSMFTHESSNHASTNRSTRSQSSRTELNAERTRVEDDTPRIDKRKSTSTIRGKQPKKKRVN